MPAEPVPPPREGPPFALSVDVEDYFQVQAFANLVPRSAWNSYPARVEGNTRRLLDLFDATGSRGTFFTLGWVARRHPSLIGEIAARGHEIGSHGDDHRMITELSRDEFRRQARDTRHLLEDLAGQPVLGYRAPSYSVGSGTLWALDILRETGYAYDSSIYPIRRKRYGYPEGPRVPERIAVGNGDATIVEFPLPTIGVGTWRLPVLAGAYLRLFPSWVSHAALRHHADRNRPLVINIHPWELDPEQPLVGSRRAPWTHYARLSAAGKILRSLLERATFAPVAERLRELGLLGADGAADATEVSP